MELETIRACIARLRHADPSNGEEIAAALADGRCPEHLTPFWDIKSTDSVLWEKLTCDPQILIYGVYSFFPQAHELIYINPGVTTISFDGRTRGRVALIQSRHQSLVIKPLQSQREDQVAKITGELGVGPQQHTTISGFLTEEFIPGRFFTELQPEQTDSRTMYQVGHNLGSMLGRLHARRIYYNDSTLSDPNGRSHLLVSPDGSCHLIDFGVSLLLDQHPEIALEDVYNFVRTLPTFNLFSRMDPGSAAISKLVRQYQGKLAETSVDEIMARDLRFTEEGLRMAARFLGDHIVEPFHSGFHETYS